MRYIITFFFFFIALIAYVQSPNATIADTIQAQKWLEDGLQAQNEGDYSKAIELIQKSIKAFEVYPQSKGLGDAYNSMYFAYAYSGDWKTALKYSKIHYQYCIDMNIPAKETGDGLNDIAYIFGELKNIDSTIHYYLKAIEIYEKADTLPNKDLGLAHHNLSFQYKDYGYLEKSLIHARKAYDYWSENEPEVSSYIASMYSNMGALYGDLNALDLYKDYLEKSVAISLELEGENGFQYAMGIANLAYYYNLVEEYETALEHGFKAIKIFKKYTDKTRSLATTYSNLAESYEGLGKLTESEAAYQKAIEVSPNKVDTYVNLFSLYLNNDQVAKYDDILKEKDRIEKMAIEINSPYLALFYANISTVYSRKEQFDEALKYMDKLLMADPDSIMAHTNKSRFYMLQGKIELAEEEKSLATIKSFSDDKVNVNKQDEYLTPPPLLERGDITTTDILQNANSEQDSKEAIKEWALEVYAKWDAHHEVVDFIAKGFLSI